MGGRELIFEKWNLRERERERESGRGGGEAVATELEKGRTVYSQCYKFVLCGELPAERDSHDVCTQNTPLF